MPCGPAAHPVPGRCPPSQVAVQEADERARARRIVTARGGRRIALESFDFRGLPITYEHTGQGEPVIMLHNGGSSHAIWDEVATRLAGNYEIFALDLLGFGVSASPVNL